MLKFVTVTKRRPVGLPDPASAPTPEKAARMEAVNDTITEAFKESDKVVTRRGVKRKKTNHHYSSETRAKIAKYAVQHGNTSAARHFSKELDCDIGESTVRGMKKAYLAAYTEAKFEEINDLAHKKRGRPMLLGQLDKLVYEHLLEIRKAGGIINRNITIATARGIVKHENSSLLAEHGGPIKLDKSWSDSFLRRYNFVKRKATKAARKLPADFEERRADFINGIAEVTSSKSIPKELVINFDQTGMKLVPVSNWTLTTQGAKQVDVIGVDDKREKR